MMDHIGPKLEKSNSGRNFGYGKARGHRASDRTNPLLSELVIEAIANLDTIGLWTASPWKGMRRDLERMMGERIISWPTPPFAWSAKTNRQAMIGAAFEINQPTLECLEYLARRQEQTMDVIAGRMQPRLKVSRVDTGVEFITVNKAAAEELKRRCEMSLKLRWERRESVTRVGDSGTGYRAHRNGSRNLVKYADKPPRTAPGCKHCLRVELRLKRRAIHSHELTLFRSLVGINPGQLFRGNLDWIEFDPDREEKLIRRAITRACKASKQQPKWRQEIRIRENLRRRNVILSFRAGKSPDQSDDGILELIPENLAFPGQNRHS